MSNEVAPSSQVPSSIVVPAGLDGDPTLKSVAGASAGLLAGAAAGAFAGPVGAIAGAVVGVVAGAAAGVTLASEAVVRSQAERELDEEIGVTGPDLGAAIAKEAPSERHAVSAASSGAAASSASAPSEGTIPHVG